MKFLILLTIFSPVLASNPKVCSQEFFNTADDYSEDIDKSNWEVKKAAVSFSTHPYVERILYSMQTAFTCDYILLSQSIAGIKINAKAEQSKECPPIGFPWRDEELIRNFDTKILPSFAYVYKFVYQKYLVIVGCISVNEKILLSGFVFIDRNESIIEMMEEITKILEEIGIDQNDLWFFNEIDDLPCMCEAPSSDPIMTTFV